MRMMLMMLMMLITYGKHEEAQVNGIEIAWSCHAPETNDLSQIVKEIKMIDPNCENALNIEFIFAQTTKDY